MWVKGSPRGCPDMNSLWSKGWKQWHEGKPTCTVQPLPEKVWWALGILLSLAAGRRSWAIRNTLESIACTVSWHISASEGSSIPAALSAWGTAVQERGWGCARACNILRTKALHQNIKEQGIKGEQMLADLVHPAPGRQPGAAAVCPRICYQPKAEGLRSCSLALLFRGQ